MPALGASLASEEGRAIKEHLIKYVRVEEAGREEAESEKDTGYSFNPQQRIRGLQQSLARLKEIKVESEGKGEERGKEVVVSFLEDLLKTCEEEP